MNKAGRLLQKRILAALISGGLLLLPSCGYTLPSGGAVVNGSGSIISGGGTMDITGSGNVAINWDSFNIAQNEIVNFKNMQAVLNYVSGSGKSEIFGKLNGSGVNVFLINPNGILFGKTAQVNVGQLTASTRKLDANALKGFNGSLAGLNATEAADVRGDIINLGRLTAGRLVLEGSNLSIIGADSLEVADKKNITLRANENINIGYEVTAKTTIDVGDGQGNTHAVSDYKDGSGSKASDVLSGATVTDLTGGGKSINDAMLVHDVYELQAINNNAEEKRNDKNYVYKYVHGNYMLANDIDASATSTWNSGKGFESIGQLTQMTMGTPKGFQGGFTGVLDGAGYTVKDLSINRSDEVYVGLFGGLTETAAVMNLNLTGNIGGKNNVGGIAARNFGMIRNVVNKANVSGESSVGGITNMNYGRLAFVSNSGDVTGTGQSSGAPGASVGGIAAYNGESVSKTGTIDSAENTGKITGGGQIGGIAGSNGAGSTIENVSNRGAVTSNVAEGLLKGAVSAEMEKTADGGSSSMTINNATVKQSQESSTMTSMRNVASVAIVSWRQEDSTLGQRLGELRSSAGDQGIWARMNRGEFEYSGAYKNQYNFFQLGYDKAFGSWHYGAAVSHNDGKTTYDNGKGENKSTSLSLYGTWLGDKGHYADIVLKQGRLSNEYDNYAAAGHTHGDYNAWGISLSGEYGMKVGLDNGWYVTPQAQLTLMRIGGEDYTTNNGIHVSQDTLKSCVGRIGFEAGKAVGSKGSIYAKASLLHEFAGNADTYLSLNGISNSYSQDIGGTWYEAGLGFNFKTTANSYVYADVVKTFGDDIKTPWQWNVGARWTF